MKNFKTVEIIIIILSLFITRIFFLNSNIFSVDGDEAILGLMALDLLNGELPVYFYGQTYGLSLLEVFPIAIWITLFGVSNIAIKLPMLLIFGIALYFLFKTMQSISASKKFWLSILFILLVILSPTWLIWSLKARGGYLTSFLSSSIFCYLLFSNINREKIKISLFAFLGILIIIIFEAQPLWLPPLIPLGVWFFLNNKLDLKKNMYAISLVMIIPTSVGYLLKIYKQNLESSWNTPTPNPFARLTKIPELINTLFNNLGGNYYLSNTYTPNNQMFAILIALIFFCILVLTILRFRVFKHTVVPYLSFSTLFSLSGFFFNAEPRYLLPFFGFFILYFYTISITLLSNNEKLKWGISGLIISLLMISILSIFSFSNYSYNNMKISEKDDILVKDQETLNQMIKLLKSEKIRYVYSTNELLQYQISFFSNKQILATSQKARSRTPWITQEILSKINSNREEFAVIGYNFHYRYTGKLPLIQNKIFYLLRPNDQILEQLGLLEQNN